MCSIVNLYSDNKSIIYITSNHIFQDRTKHTKMDCHFIQEEHLYEAIQLPNILYKFQLTDLFTKGLGAAN